MPYIDSALFLPLAASLVLLLWVAFCGALLVRYACSIRDWTLLAPLGLAAGCALFLVCANLLGYLRSVPVAFGGAFIMVSALGIFASFRLWPRSWRFPSGRSALAVCGWTFLALVVTYVCLAIRNQSYFFDFPTHLGLAATIARDNLPVRNPYSPVLPSGYHYGAALLVAALSRGAGLPAVVGYQLLAALQGASLLLLVFGLGREAGKHALWGLTSLAAALSMGSLILWLPFTKTPSALASVLQGDLSQDVLMRFPSLRGNIELVYEVLSFSTDLRWLLIYPHRLASFFTVVALAVLLVGPQRRHWGRASLALAVSLVAAISLYDETMLPLALMALGWPLLVFRRRPQRLLLWSGGLLAAALLVAFQGGSVTDALAGSSGSSPPFAFHSPGDAVRSLVLVRVLPAGWLWVLPPIPLALGCLVFVWKRWWLGLMLCLFGFAGYFGFHVLDFQGEAGTGEFSRVVNLSFLALAVATPLAIARLLRDAPWWRTALVAALLVPVTIPSLAQPVTSIVSGLWEDNTHQHPGIPGLVYTPQITDPNVTRELFNFGGVYADAAQALPGDSVVLTEYPVSFVIATGIPAAYAPISGLIFFPTHHYVPDPAFYDAYWRLDPAAWRSLGASAALYHRKSYASLPRSVRQLVEVNAWFEKKYEEGDFLLLTPTEAFFRYGTPSPNSFAALRAMLPSTESVHLSADLPYRAGQALVHLLRDHPVTGLVPDPNAHAWFRTNRPPGLAADSAAWHVRSHREVRLAGKSPEAALWRWRSPGESVGVYPNAPIPALALRKLSAGQSLTLHAGERSLRIDGGPAETSPARFRSLAVLLAGHPGSIVQLCGPAGCAHRDLAGNTWTIALPLTEVESTFTLAVIQGEAYFAGTLGYGQPLTAVRTPGVVLQPRRNGDTVAVDASYFNHEGWTLGNGIAWQLFRVGAPEGEPTLTRSSQLIIFGARGDVGFTLSADGVHTEHNFTGSDPTYEQTRALADGEYALYLSFFIHEYRTADRIPAARFTVEAGAITSFTPLPQIARLSFGSEHSEQISLAE